MRNIIFFDIDNTLWDEQMQIPESAARAMKELHEQGHLTFLCTGRARGNLRSEALMSLPFDGILAACGNHIEYHGQVLHETLLPSHILKHAIEVMTEHRMPMVLEGPTDHWIDEEGFEGDTYVDYLHEVLGDSCHPLRGYEEGMRVSKISTLILPKTNYPAIKEALRQEMDILEHPFQVLELIPKGTSKASGIEWICNYLGLSREQTYAIGDSTNDMEMLRYVRHGIAMGNAQAGVKEIAEYVTDDIHRDGLYKAMQHYGLIGGEES